MSTLYWYDIETFGRHPQLDRVAQFAGVRTNDKFEPIDNPLILYCKITPDYLPDPSACLITGITPRDTLEKGISEYEFIKRINAEFTKPGTTVVGYNSIRFDDEFIRNCYYRNFFDPYRREWANNNSRWDIIDLLRITHDLRPDGINWIRNPESNHPVFRLEELTKANNIAHDNAHDALADVYATIDLAKMIHNSKPKLFKYMFNLRKKAAVQKKLNLFTKEAVLHTSGMYTSEHGCTTVVSPIATDPKNQNCIYSWDLRYNPTILIDLSVEEIRKRLFTPKDVLNDNNERIHLKGIHVNKCPAIAPLVTLEKKRADSLALDLSKCKDHYNILMKDDKLTQKIFQVFNQDNYKKEDDPEMQIYSGGFFKDEDKDMFKLIHTSTAKEIVDINLNCRDPRIPELFRRFLGRNFRNMLDDKEKDKWKSFCAGRILFPPDASLLSIGEYDKKMKQLTESMELSAGDKVVVKRLLSYGSKIKNEVLDYKVKMND